MERQKETLCTACAHLEVCSKAEEFQRILKEVDNLTVSTGDKSMMYVRDMKWIIINGYCSHYMPKSPMVK